MTKHSRDLPQFFMTRPSPCPYVVGQMERKIFTHLGGSDAAGLNDILTQSGFRRSQSIAYRPSCETCQACISVRVLVDEFRPTRNMKRVRKANTDLVPTRVSPEPSSDQYSIFRAYLDARHSDGGMADMTIFDYALMVEDTSIDTHLIEYRLREPIMLENEVRKSGELLGVSLTDQLEDGLSMVYSFFEPECPERSLGTYMILDHIERTRRLGLPYLYLGFWVEGSDKMDYKTRFRPQQHLTPSGWAKA